MRPQSIIRFDRLFLLSIVVGIINAIVTYNSTMARVAEQAASSGVQLGNGVLLFSLCISAAIPLLIWYFIARRGSNVAKWILVVLTGLGLLFTIPALMGPMAPTGLGLFLALATTALQIAAIYYLFKADAVDWLTNKRAPISSDTFK